MSPTLRTMRLSALLPLLLTAAAQSADNQSPPVNPPPLGAASYQPAPTVDERPLTPQSFVTRAAVTNLSGIELGELAQSRSSTPEIKAFARRMIEEHQTSETQLKSVAAGQKIALPAKVDADREKIRQQLAGLQGKAFDAQYLQATQQGHRETIALFEATTQSADMPDPLRQYASQRLSGNRQHLETARALAEAATR